MAFSAIKSIQSCNYSLNNYWSLPIVSYCLIIDLRLEFTNDKRYWSLKSGNLTTTNANLIYGLRYMGTPYGMETPSDFSFVCTRTYFELYNASLPTQANVKVALYIQYFQVTFCSLSLYKQNETRIEFFVFLIFQVSTIQCWRGELALHIRQGELLSRLFLEWYLDGNHFVSHTHIHTRVRRGSVIQCKNNGPIRWS